MSQKNKLRVLCLHGCRQDSKTFNQKTGHLRKVLKSFVEFDYVSAPHSISPFDPCDFYDYRSWWYTSPDKNYNSKVPCETDKGFQESLEFIQKYILENGPYDGVLAFSQGAALLGIICLLMEKKDFCADFKFVSLFSGFKSPCIPHQKYYTTKVTTIPSLHVIGLGDQIIPKERSEELMTYFDNSEVLYHPGGHHVPAGKEQKEPLKHFFQKMLSLKEESINLIES